MNNIVNKILGLEYEVDRVVEYNNFIFLFYKRVGFDNKYDDERKSIILGAGPIKINKNTGEYEIMSIMEFYAEYAEVDLFFLKKDSEKMNFKALVSNIINRRRINWTDFDILLRENNLDDDEFDIYSENSIDDVYIEAKSEDSLKLLTDFLTSLGAMFKVDNNNKLKVFVNLIIVPAVPKKP